MRMLKIGSALVGSALLLGLGACQTSSVRAQTAPPSAASSAAANVEASAALTARAEQLVAFINGQVVPADLFAPEALARVSAERLNDLAARVRERRGMALGVDRIEASTPNIGTVFIVFPESQFSVKIRVQASTPHLIDGLEIG